MRVFYTFLILLSVCVTGFASAAMAAQGYSANVLKVRTGPGSEYPVVSNIGSARLLDIRACISGLKWCEVSSGKARGWVPADQLRAVYQNRRVQVSNYADRLNIPVVRFDKKRYAPQYYRDHDYYRNEANFHHGHGNRNDGHDHWHRGNGRYNSGTNDNQWYRDRYPAYGNYNYGYNR